MAVHSQEFSYIQPVLDLLESRVHPYAVYLFGSAVRGNLREDSDIDLAFLTDEKLSGYEQFRLAQEAAERLNREVDLINLGTIETVFRAQIVATGVLVVNRDLHRVAEFQIRAFKEYALLNEERALILNRIHDRGSLYDG
ncbi:type VII toxin-antitoxin system MntA family adenylyltransferase antitoxin [Alicyclobacillus mengziensis]|uniref:Nucleotidyltransferase domain-containing protein n=1 Tax=Alicyclobacillus mengziensis TaxID=2931921 RepID=A0A9X7Z7I8_9BACL|nr:nucleotidyltransferase domain-containing protein [Alicyclobacillus mengziensis]QSO47405.1 nucleotidyltransferase domain-containing protein [Alicyclobacillus mengziensis]